jgi:hypothetical protein
MSLLLFQLFKSKYEFAFSLASICISTFFMNLLIGNGHISILLLQNCRAMEQLSSFSIQRFAVRFPAELLTTADVKILQTEVKEKVDHITKHIIAFLLYILLVNSNS